MHVKVICLKNKKKRTLKTVRSISNIVIHEALGPHRSPKQYYQTDIHETLIRTALVDQKLTYLYSFAFKKIGTFLVFSP